MAPAAPPSFREQALQLAGRTDEVSIYKISDAIARQAIMALPEFILVQPAPKRSGSAAGKACQLFALPWWHLNSRFLPALPLKSITWRAPDGSLSLTEIPVENAGGPIRPMALGSWDDVSGLISEMAIGELDHVFRSKPVSYQFDDRGLLLAIWRLISGESPPRPKNRQTRPATHRVLFGERRAQLARREALPYWLDEKLSAKHPVLLVGTRKKHVLAIRLRRPVEPMNIGLSRKRIGSDDIHDVDPFINPFHQAAEQTSGRLVRLLAEAPPQPVEEEEKKAFMDLLSKRYSMNGRGPYSNFSIQNWGQRDGKLCISFCLWLGHKPFLQQTLPEPVFIHWDLRNYPVTVFAHMVVGSDTKTDVVNCDTLVECHHPSIWRHAFVRKLQDGGPPHYGAVCTESTRFRLVQLLSRDKIFDPAEFLVEKLRSAARVLRYGLRRRDMGISQYNQFAKVPETEFQAVVRGYDEARRFAEEARAEIIYFDR
jgi:hypothetical protein